MESAVPAASGADLRNLPAPLGLFSSMATQIPRPDHLRALHAFGVTFIGAMPEKQVASGAYAVVQMPDLEVRLDGATGFAAVAQPQDRPRPDA